MFNVAVVGATGLVGETILDILAKRDFPVDTLYPLASERSAGELISFKNRSLEVGNLADFDFNQVQIVFSSAGAEVSKKFVPRAIEAGCLIIDNTSAYRCEEGIPLVVPEVNPEALLHWREHYVVANPNCSTIQMVVALKPLHDAAGIKRINIATYQSVSGAGKEAISELAGQTASLLNGKTAKANVFSKQIAFNILPDIDVIQDNGYTKEEMKIVLETQKILEDDSIKINPTAVRVPVFYGHSEAINIETHHKITATQARNLLKKAPGIKVLDNMNKGQYPTPVTEGSGEDKVFVGRIRDDISHEHGLNLWVVADNIRKGAALNTIQIAETVINNYWE